MIRWLQMPLGDGVWLCIDSHHTPRSKHYRKASRAVLLLAEINADEEAVSPDEVLSDLCGTEGSANDGEG